MQTNAQAEEEEVEDETVITFILLQNVIMKCMQRNLELKLKAEKKKKARTKKRSISCVCLHNFKL